MRSALSRASSLTGTICKNSFSRCNSTVIGSTWHWFYLAAVYLASVRSCDRCSSRAVHAGRSRSARSLTRQQSIHQPESWRGSGHRTVPCPGTGDAATADVQLGKLAQALETQRFSGCGSIVARLFLTHYDCVSDRSSSSEERQRWRLLGKLLIRYADVLNLLAFWVHTVQ
jgi:hypothetical protein